MNNTPQKNLQEMSNHKPLGSDIFGTTTVRTDEYVLLASTIVENGETVEQAAQDIEFIDTILSIQHIRIITVGQQRTASGGIRTLFTT